MNIAPPGPGNGDYVTSAKSAQSTLRYATGKFCPSFFCGDSGYQISEIILTKDGRSLLFLHADGSRGDAIPVSALNPTAGKIMGQGVVHFTDEFTPNLVTTEVEAKRLIVALNAIKQMAGNAPQPVDSGNQVAQPAPVQSNAAGQAGLAPANNPPARQVTSASLAGSGSTAEYAGKRLAIKVVSRCPPDPDPIGLFDSNLYSKCEQSELNQVRGWVAADLARKNVFAGINGGTPNLVLTITMTQDMMDFGVAGFLTSLAPGTLKFAANYQLADTAGHVLESGAVAHDGKLGEGNLSSSAAVHVERQFAAKIANEVATGTGTATTKAIGSGTGDAK